MRTGNDADNDKDRGLRGQRCGQGQEMGGYEDKRRDDERDDTGTGMGTMNMG
jgi:hypothetical protein